MGRVSTSLGIAEQASRRRHNESLTVGTEATTIDNVKRTTAVVFHARLDGLVLTGLPSGSFLFPGQPGGA